MLVHGAADLPSSLAELCDRAEAAERAAAPGSKLSGAPSARGSRAAKQGRAAARLRRDQAERDRAEKAARDRARARARGRDLEVEPLPAEARAARQLEKTCKEQAAKERARARLQDRRIKAELLSFAGVYRPLPRPRRPRRSSVAPSLTPSVLQLQKQFARIEELSSQLPTHYDVIREVERRWGPCLALYVHGSSIFANKPPEDVDLLAVVGEPNHHDVPSGTGSQFKLGKYEVSVYTRSKWTRKMEEMDLTMLTNASLPSQFILHEKDPELRSAKVVPAKLFESAVAYAEFTWVKAYVMLEQKNDVYKAKKNASYVFRVLELACQLMEHGRIMNFRAANLWWTWIEHLWVTLRIQRGDWDIVEVALASSVRSELARLHGKLQASLSVFLPLCISSRPSVLSTVFEYVALPDFSSTAPITPCEHIPQSPCALCQQPISARDGLVAELAQCGHRFHTLCAARELRVARALTCLPADARPRGACWTCGAPLLLQLDRGAIERGGRELPGAWCGRARVRFAGYPATRLLEEELHEPGEAREETSAQSLVAELIAQSAAQVTTT
mmetsp:Transcript_77219/g.213538  ORF Transcript_77219/g.213538 Transcript_77219/m.213538 type:complete len:560 (+) Transcript_77219:104-1783(+)